jgi:hypothetical protein
VNCRAKLHVATTIPAFFDRDDGIEPGLSHAFVQRVDVRYLDLEIHAAPEWTFERRGSKAAATPRRFLKHQLHAVEVEEGKALFGALIRDAEPDQIDTKGQGSVEVCDVEFGDQAVHGRDSTRSKEHDNDIITLF